MEVWMRGGSREEKPGQHGIAHLFEHNLPASGRFLGNAENRARRSAATRGGGAGTERDFLRFYSQMAPEGLEVGLGYLADRLESDREKFTEETLRRDQDIVVSEMRRVMNPDWDIDVANHLSRGTFGADHPYGHATYRSEAEVRAATVELMREWHRRFAGAANVLVLLTGNFDPAHAEQVVRRHFAPIAPGERAPLTREWVPLVRPLRETLEKNFARGVVYLRWPTPPWGSADADRLRLFAQVLGNRMPDARVEVELFELANAFTLRGEFTERPDDVEKTMRAELERALDGVTAEELARAQLQLRAQFVRSLERTAFRGSRADVIGMGLMFRDDPEHYRTQLARIAAATPAEVQEAARRWLGRAGYTLHVMPRPQRAAVGTIDRSATVNVPARLAPRVPAVQEKRFDDGVRVLVATRRALPLVQLTLASEPGVEVDARAALEAIGAEVETSQDPDYALVHVSVLSERVGDAVRMLTERAKRPYVLIASGDVELTEIRPSPGAAAGATLSRERERGVEAGIHVVDNPTAAQSVMVLRVPLEERVAKDPLLALVVSFSLRQRLMANLRETRGWSYEVYPFGVELRRGGAAMHFKIPVQTDKTGESIAEVRREMARLRDELAAPEFLGAIRSYVEGARLTAGLTSLEALNLQLLELARNDLPPAYYDDALRRLATVTPQELQAAARALLREEHVSWTITGNKAAIEKELTELQ